MADPKTKFLSTILGLAIGDVLGGASTTEPLSFEEIIGKYGKSRDL